MNSSFTDGPDRIVGPERGAEAELGVKTGMLAPIDVTGFVQDVDFIRVE